ncbi:SpoIIE family protein phosphatase [Acetonema longum]|uniref:Stage II sporulation protein E n=1 Tax=Acetonema longum DSM 6540 TaxID=1009370 RepID=F7NQ83_9FIRM|nr:SpoIIE family protein phosphatase [Acetonema longum]EGO61842.1 stage II sporulation protein E [Acetonema longum DSM 6540]
MNPLHAEIGVAQLSKVGEELCGDKLEIARTADSTIIVLSDGLGSGVKANILATLTTKIACSMLKRGIPLDEVVNTITETLPVCSQRKIAYSTFQIVEVTNQGQATVVEFDSPSAYLLRNGRVSPFPTQVKLIGNKVVNIGQLLLQTDDIIVLVSDGVIHAGIGGLLKLGWNWDGIAHYLESECWGTPDPEGIVQKIMQCCEGYYLGKPGDDSTAAAIRLRQPRYLTLFTGPPSDAALDEKVVKRLMRQPGVKIAAGGTTAAIISKVIHRPLRVDTSYYDPQIPPIGFIEGIDLVTEGVLTLNATVERIRDAQGNRGSSAKDGASLLANLLLQADIIQVFAGTAVNPAHQNPHFPQKMNIKTQVLEKLRTILEIKGKQVTLEWF